MRKDRQDTQHDGEAGERAGDAPSPRDLANLAALEPKLQLVRDYVNQVVARLTTGMYLFGEGGIGKSYTVLMELERLKADYKVYNSRMTGLGLFNALEKFPDS